MNWIDLLFGCWHTRLSFPRSCKPGQRRTGAALQTGTYVVCLRCGKQFPYDWQNMRVVRGQKQSLRGHAALEAESPEHVF